MLRVPVCSGVLKLNNVFPGELLSDLAFEIAQLMKKGGQTRC